MRRCRNSHCEQLLAYHNTNEWCQPCRSARRRGEWCGLVAGLLIALTVLFLIGLVRMHQ